VKPKSRIRDELQDALVRGIRDYAHLAVGIGLVGGPITFYLVIVGTTVTTAVPTITSFLGIITTAVLVRKRRRPR
jgi:hypothetical protein